jgi:cell division protein FtsZ
LNIDEEESAEQVITELLDEEHPKAELKTVALELDDEHEITQEPETLQIMESSAISTDTMKVEARERENRLRAISQQLRTPSGLTDLEDVPAYKRNNIELEETTHSAEDEVSTYTLSDGKNNTTELKQNNSFLHDNVD